MKKYALRKKEMKTLKEELAALDFKESFKQVFIVEDEFKLIEVDGEVLFFYQDDTLVPTLNALNKGLASLPGVVVDMGAVKFVAGGADIMRPGIVEISEMIKKGSLVKVLDEKNKIAISVARALMDYDAMQKAASGKSLKNIHFVGDKIWSKTK